MAYLCNIYQSHTLRGEEYNEDTDIIQINFTDIFILHTSNISIILYFFKLYVDYRTFVCYNYNGYVWNISDVFPSI